MLLMWIGDKITEKGLGNGSSIIIFIGIVSGIPKDIISTVSLVKSGKVQIWAAVLLEVLIVLSFASVTYIQEATCKIPVQYAT